VTVFVCRCDAAVKVAGLCYFCCKELAGLFGSNGHGTTLTEEQAAFVGIFRHRRPRDGWQPADGWVRSLDPDPDVDLERTAMLRFLAAMGGMDELPSV
jgi:hypothetical protein